MNGNAVGIPYATLMADRLATLKAMMDSVIDTEGTYVVPILKAIFAIYLGRQFLMMWGGYFSYTTFVKTVLRAGIVILLVVRAGAYVQWVRDPIFDRIPIALAAMTSNRYGFTMPASVGQQFDDSALAINNITAQILALNTGWGVSAFGNYLSASLQNGAAQTVLGCISAVWMLALELLAILLCFGKIMLLFELFDRTRGFMDQYIGKIIGLLAFGFATNILMALQMAELMNLMSRVASRMPTNAAEAVSVLTRIFGDLVYDLLTLVAVPTAVGFGSAAAASLAAPAAMLFLRGGTGAVGAAGRGAVGSLRNSAPRPRRP